MTTDKWTQKLLTWLETQPAETQTRIKGMLDKGLINEIKAELPAGWASKADVKKETAPKETKPAAKKASPAKADAPKAAPENTKPAATKIKSVASNPAAKATADAVKAEATAAEATGMKAGAAVAKKGLGSVGKVFAKYGGPAIVAGNLYGRGKELYDDLGAGKSLGEAINKPESNKKLGEAVIDTALMYAGGAAGQKLAGTPGAVIGGAAAPMLGNLAMRVGDVAVFGPKQTKEAATQSQATQAPARKVSYDEIQALADEKGIPFDDAFRQLQERQQQEINKRAPVQEEIRKAQPVSDIYSPTTEQSLGLAREAVRAPVSIQDADILSFLQQPDNEQMLAELSAKQQRKIASASNEAGPNPFKKMEDDEESDSPSGNGRTNPANVRPPPRFYVNTGRFGSLVGAGSRRSPDGRLY